MVNHRPACDFDAVVVGGGFYGTCIAIFLAERFDRVALLEKEPGLLTRASYVNQARVHGGYHYPRSFMTAVRSAMHLPRFLAEYKDCIDDEFEAIYAVARNQSQVNAYQFQQFCARIGAPVRPASQKIQSLFQPELVEDVFSVVEHAFDAAKLREIMIRRLLQARVEVFQPVDLEKIVRREDGTLLLEINGGADLTCRAVFNCTYSQINRILVNSGVDPLPFKHEIAELALIEPPEPIRNLGITVMDGPFFSTMPFPARKLHTLTHVRYTPHESWREPDNSRDAHQYLKEGSLRTNYPFMLKDSQRYLPCLADSRYVESLFEVKTVLTQNEVDDGRPILFRQHPELGNAVTIMGGKIDNIYDVLAKVEQLRELAWQKVALQ